MNNSNDHDDNNDFSYNGNAPEDWVPPSEEQLKLEESADFVGFEFAKLELYPHEPWFIISHAGRSLVGLVNKRRAERLPAHRRDKLTAGILTGRQAVLETLSDSDADLEHLLTEAFDGALVLADYLGASDQERAARHRHVVIDASDRLMIAVLAARTHCLVQDIQRRAEDRIKEEVGSLVAASLQAAGLLTADQVANRGRRHG